MDSLIPQSVQRSTFRKQHSQLGDVNNADEGDVDPEENSDAPFNSVNNTEDAKTQRDFDKSKTDDVAFDVLSKACVDPFRDEEGVWEADNLSRDISRSIFMPGEQNAYNARNEHVVVPTQTFTKSRPTV